MNKIYYGLTAAVIGVSIALVQLQQAAALSPTEVNEIAKQITVLIDSNKPGTGIIIRQEGDTYTVLTAAHVVKEDGNKYEIVTPDKKRYLLDYSTVKKLPNVDLAILQFTSSNSYRVAKIGNSDSAKEGTAVYIAGFALGTIEITTSTYLFREGLINGRALPALRDGYALLYSNNTLPGMSGGPVINENGELVGVHGRGDREKQATNLGLPPGKTGFNLGIPINTFLRIGEIVGFEIKLSASDLLAQGIDKLNRGDFNGAIADLNQAIALNPSDADAYKKRGSAYYKLKEYQAAIADYSSAIKLNSKDADNYKIRGDALFRLGKYQSAIQDYDKAISLKPNNPIVYYNRGSIRHKMSDYQVAIADYRQAIDLDRKLWMAIYKIGLIQYETGDSAEAMNQWRKAIAINDKAAEPILALAVALYVEGSRQQSVETARQAISLDSNCGNLEFLKKNLWGDRLLTDTQELLKTLQ